MNNKEPVSSAVDEMHQLLVDARNVVNLVGAAEHSFADFEFRDNLVSRIDAALSRQQVAKPDHIVDVTKMVEPVSGFDRISAEWERQKKLFPVLSKDGWMDALLTEIRRDVTQPVQTAKIYELLRKIMGSGAGKQVLDKLSRGQSTGTEEGQAWLSLKSIVDGQEMKVQTAGVPEGWKLVPIEPTREMTTAAQFHTEKDDEDFDAGDTKNYRARGQALAVWHEMISNSPPAPSKRKRGCNMSEAKYVVMFLNSMEQPEMAETVLSMANRLDAFANQLDKDCINVMVARIEELERQLAERAPQQPAQSNNDYDFFGFAHELWVYINARQFPEFGIEDSCRLIAERLREEFDGGIKKPEQSEDVRDAARYRWLRDGNAYAPEEESIRGYEALDELIDDAMQKENLYQCLDTLADMQKCTDGGYPAESQNNEQDNFNYKPRIK